MMKERSRIVVTGLVSLLLIIWIGFGFHHSPRFAGSLWGGVLAVTGSALMLVPLAYLVIKRLPLLRRQVQRFVSMRTLLAWHIYAGVLGPIFVLLHTGHKFESVLGIMLTGMTLVVVVSGFVGRYLMHSNETELHQKREMLAGLREGYDSVQLEIAHDPSMAEQVGFFRRTGVRLLGWAFAGTIPAFQESAAMRAMRLSEAIADVEYAIRTHESVKRAFRVWLRFHIVISLVLYVLLGLHVWAAFHFGLRWFT